MHLNSPGGGADMNLGSKRFLLVDALRGIAAMSVFVFHLQAGHHVDLIMGVLPAWLAVILKYGYLGVAIFFVLSGFVIAHSLYSWRWVELPSIAVSHLLSNSMTKQIAWR
jgi:peptidoglycan/LPS O-acetylase OafA/YrhL